MSLSWDYFSGNKSRIEKEWKELVFTQLSSMQNSDLNTDLAFICSDGSVKAHKAWLIEKCHLLKEILLNHHACPNDDITIMLPDFNVKTVKNFLNLYYQGSLNGNYEDIEAMREFGCVELGFEISFNQMSFLPTSDNKVLPQQPVQETMAMTGNSDHELVADSSSIEIRDEYICQSGEESVVVNSETKNKRKRKQKVIVDIGFSDEKVPKKVLVSRESFVDSEVVDGAQAVADPSTKVLKQPAVKRVPKSKTSFHALAKTLEISTASPKKVCGSLDSDKGATSVQNNEQTVINSAKIIKQRVTKRVPKSKNSSTLFAKAHEHPEKVLVDRRESVVDDARAKSLQVPEGTQTAAVPSKNVLKQPITKSVLKIKNVLAKTPDNPKNALVGHDFVGAYVKAPSQQDDAQTVVTSSKPFADTDIRNAPKFQNPSAVLPKTSEVPTVNPIHVPTDCGEAVVEDSGATITAKPSTTLTVLTHPDTKTVIKPWNVSAVFAKTPEIQVTKPSKVNNNRLSLPEASKNIKRQRPSGLKYNISLNSKTMKKVSNSLSKQPFAALNKPVDAVDKPVAAVGKPVATAKNSPSADTSKSLVNPTSEMGNLSNQISSGIGLKTEINSSKITISSSNMGNNFSQPLMLNNEFKTSVQVFDGNNSQNKQTAFTPQSSEPLKKPIGRPLSKGRVPYKPKPKQFTVQGTKLSTNPEIKKQPQKTLEPSWSKSINMKTVVADNEKVSCMVCSDTFDTYPAMRSHMKLEHNLDQNIEFFH